MTFGSVLRALRVRSEMTQKQLADVLGLSESAIGMYERGHREPDFETLETIADYFNVDMDYLTGRSDIERRSSMTGLLSDVQNIRPMPEFVKVPRIGRIACGTPILAEENIEDYDDVPSYVKCDFTLICRGDSMINARIFDGDIVCIKMQPVVSSGDIAAVMVGEDEATLKRVRIFEDHVVLEPENPMYKPLTFWGEDMNSVHIIGKATHFISTVR